MKSHQKLLSKTLCVFYVRCPASRPSKNPEMEGFEPSRRFSRPTPFPGEPLQPLGYISKAKENGEDGIRTHVPVKANGFQDRLVMTTSIPLHTHKNYSVFNKNRVVFSERECYLIKSELTCQSKIRLFFLFFIFYAILLIVSI